MIGHLGVGPGTLIQHSHTGDIVVDLGSTLTNCKRDAKLGKRIVQLTSAIIHMIAHVAGAAANEFIRLTGLNRSNINAKNRNCLAGLARGDAEFVDAIHTSVYGMGTPLRSGDVDFYPNGLSAGVPVADNVVEATMHTTQ